MLWSKLDVIQRFPQEDSSLAELGVYEIRNKKRHTQFAREVSSNYCIPPQFNGLLNPHALKGKKNRVCSSTGIV